ncbi:LysE family translocator [Salinarimonas sp. NSM]|uniref:LysE family translocator n=1 Tax=Salinarimonas sp. NSM TaxID=3458003 RepID=UPI004037177C
MDEALVLLGILGALLAGAISPGPSFVLVCRSAMLYSRKAGLSAALGMGLGGAIFGSLALLGLGALLREVPSLHVALKLVGGAYLLYLACRIWRGATEILDVREADATGGERHLRRVFWLSLTTQLSNPKTAVVYGSIFAAFLPANPPVGLLLALVPGIFLVEFAWYAVVGTVFSSRRPQAAYLRSKRAIDRVIALILGGLGGKLLYEGLSQR